MVDTRAQQDGGFIGLLVNFFKMLGDALTGTSNTAPTTDSNPTTNNTPNDNASRVPPKQAMPRSAKPSLPRADSAPMPSADGTSSFGLSNIRAPQIIKTGKQVMIEGKAYDIVQIASPDDVNTDRTDLREGERMVVNYELMDKNGKRYASWRQGSQWDDSLTKFGRDEMHKALEELARVKPFPAGAAYVRFDKGKPLLDVRLVGFTPKKKDFEIHIDKEIDAALKNPGDKEADFALKVALRSDEYELNKRERAMVASGKMKREDMTKFYLPIDGLAEPDPISKIVRDYNQTGSAVQMDRKREFTLQSDNSAVIFENLQLNGERVNAVLILERDAQTGGMVGKRVELRKPDGSPVEVPFAGNTRDINLTDEEKKFLKENPDVKKQRDAYRAVLDPAIDAISMGDLISKNDPMRIHEENGRRFFTLQDQSLGRLKQFTPPGATPPLKLASADVGLPSGPGMTPFVAVSNQRNV